MNTSALAVERSRAIADLRYGTIAVNAWTGGGHLTATASWGAYPGRTLNDVQSGPNPSTNITEVIA
jgi:aldehyde dehydrogenase (NAD(P)+)